MDIKWIKPFYRRRIVLWWELFLWNCFIETELLPLCFISKGLLSHVVENESEHMYYSWPSETDSCTNRNWNKYFRFHTRHWSSYQPCGLYVLWIRFKLLFWLHATTNLNHFDCILSKFKSNLLVCPISLQVIRFGHDWDPACMKMDEVLYGIAEKVKNFAVFYLVDISEVSDFNKMWVNLHTW